MWQTQNPNKKLDPKSYFILNCFSEFQVKILEQAMISFYSPQINSSTFPVTFSFTNVNIQELNPKTYTDLRFKAVRSRGL